VSTDSARGGTTLEALLAELDEAIGQLAGPDASLDALVGEYERARSLLSQAQSRLEATRVRAAALQKSLLAVGSPSASAPEPP
jgi:exodeoxyribonuclease VII small subunit